MKLFDNISHNWAIAFEAIAQNKVRSALTSLGIICGTASVIGMLAIGTGAKSEVLEKMQILGTNNIIIRSEFSADGADGSDSEEGDSSNSESGESTSGGSGKETEGKKKFSPGLSMADLKSIKEEVPGIKTVSPSITHEGKAYRKQFKMEPTVVGIDLSYHDVKYYEVINGRDLNRFDIENSKLVCLIGSETALKLFPADNPVGKKLKTAGLWFTVVGVLGARNYSESSLEGLGVRDMNKDIYIPISTMLMRMKNTRLITKKDLGGGSQFSGGGGRIVMTSSSGERQNYHQLATIIVRVDDTKKMKEYAEIIKRMLIRRHNGVEDFEVIIPEVLLKQEQETTRIFNFVLGVIASISLIVGGIGIMNIMLASIMERTREIGIRMAVGALRQDIAEQFLFEAIAISLTGGILGVIAGVGASFLIEMLSGINTIVTFWSVLLAFVVSIATGLVFGIFPAKKAARQNTIELLRYE